MAVLKTEGWRVNVRWLNPNAKSSWSALTALAVSAVLCGCATTSQPEAPSSGVGAVETDRAARTLALEGEGRSLGRGSGLSMLPVFGENTRVVVAPIEFDALEPDMIVAYRDRNGRLVVHRLVVLLGGRWTAAGINNPQIDTEPVTRENLIGVVYAFFQSEPE